MDRQELEDLVHWSSVAMIVTGLVTFVACMLISAPYGRYTTSKGWGVQIPAKLAWILMESPNLWMPIVIYVYLSSQFIITLPSCVLLCMFVSHYVNRTIIYPLRMPTDCSEMPISVAWLAFTYCTWNSCTQVLSLCVVTSYPQDWITDVRFLLGLAIFLTGMYMNISSDNALLAIRLHKGKDGEKVYAIPRGGLFEYISCANYGSEIFEWTGFAIACWSLPAAAFAFYTFCNIGPRGYRHHQWYIQKFREDYPKSRKAVIPFIW